LSSAAGGVATDVVAFSNDGSWAQTLRVGVIAGETAANSGQRFTKGTRTLACGKGGATHSFGLTMDTVLPGTVNGTAATKQVSSGAGSTAYVAPGDSIPGWAITLITRWAMFLRRERERRVGNQAG
jgi:hypothetical protein